MPDPDARTRSDAGLRFPVIDASAWVDPLSGADEWMGSAVKRWLEPPRDSPLRGVATRWLYKEVRTKVVHGETRVFGEDWAEKVVSELALELGIPSVRVELAEFDGRRGVLSPSFTDPSEAFTPGNELLSGQDSSYPTHKTGQVRGYNLEAVDDILTRTSAPAGTAASLPNAFAAFAGYLVLDALVANTDRHHENWGVIDRAAGSVRLAPSYDHATALGFQEPEERKEALLENDADMARWAARGRSRHFEGKPDLVALASDALRMAGTEVAAHWRTGLERLEPDTWIRILDRVPDDRMSQVDRRFAATLLRLNRERLLDAC
jgi:hypothetical protein